MNGGTEIAARVIGGWRTAEDLRGIGVLVESVERVSGDKILSSGL
jgi:hypothetical protein